MDCPDHSTYNAFAPLDCLPTCQDPDVCAALQCSAVETVEACVCDKGYLKEGSVCVPAQECGCINDGVYYVVCVTKYRCTLPFYNQKLFSIPS